MYPLAEKANHTPIAIKNSTCGEDILATVKNITTKAEEPSPPSLLHHSTSGTSISSKNLTSSTSIAAVKSKDGIRSVKLPRYTIVNHFSLIHFLPSYTLFTLSILRNSYNHFFFNS